MKGLHDLEIFQRSRKLVAEIYRLTKKMILTKDFSLSDQMRRSSVSIVSNIAEGYGRSGMKENIQFLNIAKGSCSELYAQLIIAFDLDYITKEKVSLLTDECDHISRMITNYQKYLQKKFNNKSPK